MGPLARGRRAGSKDGNRERELLRVLAADQRNLTTREIAVELWGAERVAREWHGDGWMRSLVRRRVRKARAMLKEYRELAAGQ